MIVLILMRQDWKQRTVSLYLLVLLGFLNFTAASVLGSPVIALKNMLFGFAFLAAQLFLVSIYFSIRRKKIKHIVNDEFGLGDILFLCALTPLFHPIQWMFFLVFGLGLSICLSLLLRKMIKKSDVPFVTLFAAAFEVAIIVILFNLIPASWNLPAFP